jgi:hypothetical protein
MEYCGTAVCGENGEPIKHITSLGYSNGIQRTISGDDILKLLQHRMFLEYQYLVFKQKKLLLDILSMKSNDETMLSTFLSKTIFSPCV